LYITFLIRKEQFALVSKSIHKNNYKVRLFAEIWVGAWIVDRDPDVTFIWEHFCACG